MLRAEILIYLSQPSTLEALEQRIIYVDRHSASINYLENCFILYKTDTNASDTLFSQPVKHSEWLSSLDGTEEGQRGRILCQPSPPSLGTNCLNFARKLWQ